MNDEEAEKALDKHIAELAKKLDINVKNLVQFTMISGSELIGEIIPPPKNKKQPKETMGWHFVFEPVKIIRDVFINEEGEYDYQQLFIEWNPHMTEPFIPLNPLSVETHMKPNKIFIVYYLETLYEKYFPELSQELILHPEETVPVSKGKKKEKSNVIDFNKWKDSKK